MTVTKEACHWPRGYIRSSRSPCFICAFLPCRLIRALPERHSPTDGVPGPVLLPAVCDLFSILPPAEARLMTAPPPLLRPRRSARQCSGESVESLRFATFLAPNLIWFYEFLTQH